MSRDDDDSNKNITDQCFTLNKHLQQRLKGQAWTSKTWFKVKPGTSTTMTNNGSTSNSSAIVWQQGKTTRKRKETSNMSGNHKITAA